MYKYGNAINKWGVGRGEGCPRANMILRYWREAFPAKCKADKIKVLSSKIACKTCHIRTCMGVAENKNQYWKKNTDPREEYLQKYLHGH